MKKKINQLINISQPSFLKNVFMLASGTAGGQLVLILVSPILTRIYTPENFGILSVFTAVLSILAVIVSLRYQIAILIPKSYKTALELFVISLIITTFISFSVLVTIFIWGDELLKLLKIEVTVTYFYLLPLSLFFLGLYQTFVQLTVRKEKFKIIAKTKFWQSFVLGISQVVFGFLFKGGSLGLLLGDTLGRLSGNFNMLKSLTYKDIKLIQRMKIRSLVSTAKNYIKFPLYSSFSGLLNNGVLQLPPILLTVTYSHTAVGFFALGQRVIGVPMKMIGQSIAEVYLGECAKLSREDPKKLLILIKRISVRLFLIGAGPFIILLVAGPKIFEMVFGHEWRVTGEYIQLLSVMYLVQFIVFPLSQTLEILGKQKTQLIYQFIRGVLTFSALIFPPILNQEVTVAIFLFSLASTGTYIFLYFTIVFHIKQLINEL